MKTIFAGLLLLMATSIGAQEQARTFQLADAPRYSEETGYGYDLAATPEKGSKAPFFFYALRYGSAAPSCLLHP